MRTINLIVIHCSATREDKSFTEYNLDVCHRRRGFNGAGYHFYIRKNGDIKSTLFSVNLSTVEFIRSYPNMEV